MSKNNNLRTVVRFEIVRNLKKPSFWMAAILLPVLLVGYMFLAGMNGMGVGDALLEGANVEGLRLGLFDEAGLVQPREAEGESGLDQTRSFVEVGSREEGVEMVKAGEIDVFYFVPGDFAENPNVRIYAKTDRTDLFANYEGPIRAALAESAAARMATEDLVAVTGAYEVVTTNFTASGEADDVLGRMVVPIVALALFYILICMFGNRLMMATVEEKENRITEMLLVTVSPTTLVLGKIISLIALGLIQVAVLVLPMIIFYLYGGTQGILPADLNIAWDFWTICSSLLLLVLSYFLFTGLAVAIGALVPTAKELAPYASVFMILVIMPLFSLSSFMSAEPSALTYIMSYFPLSAPVALMMRNAFGVLPGWELGLGLGVLAASSALAVALAVWIFKRSAMDFTSRISVRALLAKGTRTKW